MTIKRIHLTRKEAVQYLAIRGWTHTATVCGSRVFQHPSGVAFKNIIVPLANGKWIIEAWG